MMEQKCPVCSPSRASGTLARSPLRGEVEERPPFRLDDLLRQIIEGILSSTLTLSAMVAPWVSAICAVLANFNSTGEAALRWMLKKIHGRSKIKDFQQDQK